MAKLFFFITFTNRCIKSEEYIGATNFFNEFVYQNTSRYSVTTEQLNKHLFSRINRRALRKSSVILATPVLSKFRKNAKKEVLWCDLIWQFNIFIHCVKYARIRFSLTCMLLYKDSIYNSFLTRENRR